ncbi:unnamed protein product [Heligmosomoides polygyrus]|uniref:ARID domain-containing protein n=1 Tax=Heligmosomoides polygyrus TaxID=6339 RepID=A0A183GSR0_HELPZ|nr:unnamed protein product [Heligmosomoides polygyrus]
MTQTLSDDTFLETVMKRQERSWTDVQEEMKQYLREYETCFISGLTARNHWSEISSNRQVDGVSPAMRFVTIQKLLRKAIAAKEQMVRVTTRYVILSRLYEDQAQKAGVPLKTLELRSDEESEEDEPAPEADEESEEGEPAPEAAEVVVVRYLRRMEADVREREDDLRRRVNEIGVRIRDMRKDFASFPFRKAEEVSEGIDPTLRCAFCAELGIHYSESCPTITDGMRDLQL